MREILIDLGRGVRLLTRAPAFSTLAVSILAAGIGAAALMFSLVHAVLLRALPFDDPARVVWMYNQRTERDRAPLSVPDVEDYRRQASTLAGLTTFTNWTANLTGAGGAPERLEGTRVAGNFFELLGSRPFLGRPIQAGDEVGEARVAVLTYGLWIRRFAGDRSVVGRGVLLNAASYTIIGVLPPGFMFPFRDAEVAVPLIVRSDPRRTDRGANFLRVLARLGPGVTIEQARMDLDAIAHRLQTAYPTEDARKTGVSLYPLHAEIVRDYRSVLWTLFASVGVLLATGCGNLANLLLVRTAGRQTEFAVRLSLGASRGRLARQLLAEAAVLALAGGAAGIGLAAVGVSAWRAWGPAGFPRMAQVALNLDVLSVAAGISGVTALVCGLVPACFLSRDVATAVRGTTRTLTSGRGFARLRRAFVATQIAGSTVLLVGMVLTARGLARLERVAPGFTADESLSVQLSLPPASYASRDALVRFADALEERLRVMPGVQASGAVSLLPLSGLLSTMDIAFPGRPAPPPDEVPQAHFRVASTGYFAAAGIAVTEGRAFSDHDRTGGRPVAIVSHTFASRHWPNQSAIGQAVQLVQSGASAPLEIVGVVSDVKHFTLDAPATADLYVPLRQMPGSQAAFLASRMFWVIRAHGAASSLESAIREAVAQIDPGVAASSARTLEAVVSRSLGAARLNVRLLEVFGQVAAALCAIGVYAIAAFSARTRRRELAIRIALGARRRDLTRLMVVTELRPVFTGVALGLGVAWLTSGRLFGVPFETSPHDATAYLEVGLGLLALGTAASYAPVRRAGAANPAEALQM
jgi:predicted permease